MFGVCAQWEGRDHRAVQPISRVRSHWNQPWERCSVCRDETDHCVRTSSVEMWTNSEQKTDLDNSDNKIIFDYFDRRWSGETCWGLCRTNALSYICRAEFVGKTGQNSKGQDRTGQDRKGEHTCYVWTDTEGYASLPLKTDNLVLQMALCTQLLSYRAAPEQQS